jgi:competence protein ComEC
VTFLDVGQGDAIYINIHGYQALIDTGKDERVVQELQQHMPLWDRSLDALIITHPDRDHYYGGFAVLEYYDVTQIYTIDYEKEDPAWTEFLKQAAGEGELTFIEQPMVLDIENIAQFEFLMPYGNRDISYLDSNEASVVNMLIYDEQKVLLTGDMGISGEEELVGIYNERLESQVLKLGHHGSKTSSSEEFLSTVNPEICIASAARKSSYNHPDPVVVHRAQRLGCTVYNTFDGAVTYDLMSGELIQK